MIARVMKSLAAIVFALWLSLFFVTLLPAQKEKGTSPSGPRSPFEPGKALPEPEQKAPPKTPPAKSMPIPPNKDIELRGYMQWKDVWYFSIYDIRHKESYFITKGKGESGFEVVDWEPYSHKLRLSNQGKHMILEIKEPAYKPLAG